MINPKERRQPKTWPFITLAEAVTWLALRRYVSKETLHRLDRFHRRRFGTLKPEVPQELQKKLEATERKLERWIRGQRVHVWGRLQRGGDEGQASRTVIPQEFLGVGVYLEYRSDSKACFRQALLVREIIVGKQPTHHGCADGIGDQMVCRQDGSRGDLPGRQSNQAFTGAGTHYGDSRANDQAGPSIQPV